MSESKLINCKFIRTLQCIHEYIFLSKSAFMKPYVGIENKIMMKNFSHCNYHKKRKGSMLSLPSNASIWLRNFSTICTIFGCFHLNCANWSYPSPQVFQKPTHFFLPRPNICTFAKNPKKIIIFDWSHNIPNNRFTCHCPSAL